MEAHFNCSRSFSGLFSNRGHLFRQFDEFFFMLVVLDGLDPPQIAAGTISDPSCKWQTCIIVLQGYFESNIQ